MRCVTAVLGRRGSLPVRQVASALLLFLLLVVAQEKGRVFVVQENGRVITGQAIALSARKTARKTARMRNHGACTSTSNVTFSR
jgi:hypothetical protein